MFFALKIITLHSTYKLYTDHQYRGHYICVYILLILYAINSTGISYTTYIVHYHQFGVQ